MTRLTPVASDAPPSQPRSKGVDFRQGLGCLALLRLLDGYTRIAACFNLTGLQVVTHFIGSDHRAVIVGMDWRDPYFNISDDVDDSAFASHTVCRELNQLLLRHPGGELLPLSGLLFWQREANQVVCEDKCEGVQGQTFKVWLLISLWAPVMRRKSRTFGEQLNRGAIADWAAV